MDQILNQLQSSVSLQYTVMASLGFASTKLMIKVNKHIHWQEKKMPTEKKTNVLAENSSVLKENTCYPRFCVIYYLTIFVLFLMVLKEDFCKLYLPLPQEQNFITYFRVVRKNLKV